MKSCDDCPNTTDCAGVNLHPVLGRVLKLYQGGTTDKFDILFALSDEDEALLEKFDHRVSSTCWSKAALLTIADVLAALPDAPTDVNETISTAVDAFQRFPWRVEDLVDQAPDLYQAVKERNADDSFADAVSKRAFMKICKDIAYRT